MDAAAVNAAFDCGASDCECSSCCGTSESDDDDAEETGTDSVSSKCEVEGRWKSHDCSMDYSQ